MQFIITIPNDDWVLTQEAFCAAYDCPDDTTPEAFFTTHLLDHIAQVREGYEGGKTAASARSAAKSQVADSMRNITVSRK